MNLYHYYLDIPVKFEPVFLEPNFAHHNQYDLSLLSFEYIKWFNDLGLTIKFGELFTRHVGQPPVPIHIDQYTDTEHVKINYVFCEGEHRMIWYKLTSGKQIQIAKTGLNTDYAWARDEDCEEVYSAVVGQPSLVNASILHGAPTITASRWCFSFSLYYLDPNRGKLTWNDAVEIFKDYIK